MAGQMPRTIDYYVWLMSDWASLGGVRFVQMAARHGVRIDHIPMRMQDVYAGSGSSCSPTVWAEAGLSDHGVETMARKVWYVSKHRTQILPANVDMASCMVIAGQRRHLPVADLVNAIMRAMGGGPGRIGPRRADHR